MMLPYWFAYLFGGNYRWGWRPNIYQYIRRFYREKWYEHETLWEWLGFGGDRFLSSRPNKRNL